MGFLNTGTTPIISGEGPKDCKICFIGEAPGSSEAALGKPFVGASGREFNAWLQVAGINRSDCYITNVVKEQPPNNDISHFIEFKPKKVLTTELYQMYEEVLHKELAELTEATVFVPMGNVSMYALCREVGIMKHRGSVYPGVLNGRSVKIIPTIHPSACLRQYIWRWIAIRDLRKIVEESKSPDLILPDRTLRINPSFDESMSYLQSIQSGDTIGFDIETGQKEISCLAVAKTELDVICIPFDKFGSDYFDPRQETMIWQELTRILESPEICKIGQNLTFDASFIFNRMQIITRNTHDTMVAMALLVPEFPKGLDFITSIFTAERYYKDEGKRWFKIQSSIEDFWRYNCKDAAVCLEAFPKMRKELESLGNWAAYERVNRLFEPIIFLQEHGILVDTEGMANSSAEAKIEAANLRAQLSEICGFDLNPASPKQLQKYFYEEKGYKPIINRKTGNPTTDDDAMKKLSLRYDCKEAKLIREIRKLEKMDGTYYEMEYDTDKRLRCSINRVGTTSGRLSSSKNIFGTGGNFQNFPPDMKRFLLADPEHVIYNIDLSQAENRVVAYIAPEPSMIRAFETGVDIHRLTASLIFRKPIEEISDEDGSCEIGGGLYSERFWGKKANHALNYGLSGQGFAHYYETTKAEGEFIRDSYLRAYPGITAYHEWVKHSLNHDHRILTNCLGRRRLFLDRWGDSLFKEAYSFIPQSTVGEKMNQSGVYFTYYNPDLRLVTILNTVHDSLVIQIPLSAGWAYHADALLAIKSSLESPLTWKSYTFSIPADCTLGLTCAAKTKVPWKNLSSSELAAMLPELYNKTLEESSKKHESPVT